MTRPEWEYWIHDNLFTAGMNQQYHQTMAWRWEAADIILGLVVAILAIASVVCAANKNRFGKYSLWVSSCGVVLMILLLFFPSGTWKLQYKDLFNRWTNLRQRVEALQIQLNAIPEGEPIPEYFDSQAEQITAMEQDIASDEGAPHRVLLLRCFGDQAERMYGKGIRTPEQIDEFLEAKKSAPPDGNG